MKKAIFFLLYLLTPVLPVFLYLNSLGFGYSLYAVSVSLGIVSFVFLCNQFILACRPTFVVRALGLKGLLSFHGSMPFIILSLAAVHRILKLANGYSEHTVQATLGSGSWWLFTLLTVFTVLLMANTFWMKFTPLKSLKDWIYRNAGLSYQRARIIHNLTVVGALLILVHVFLASSSDLRVNPLGIALMGLWMLFSLGLYGLYRIKGRSLKGK